MVKNSSSTSPR